MRVFLFVVAFAIGLLLYAPLERWLLPFLRNSIPAGTELEVGRIRIALPGGIRATDVTLGANDLGVLIDSLYLGLSRTFEADACGGHLRGHAGPESIQIDLEGIDPSRCVRARKLELESTLDGSIFVSGFDIRDLASSAKARADVDLHSEGGVFRGVLEGAGQGGTDLPLGEWEFTDLVVRGSLEDGKLDVEEAHTNTSGVEWELTGGSIPESASRSALRIDFRARAVEDNPRARALIGLMPKAPADAKGWHNYRVTGSLQHPRVIAVE